MESYINSDFRKCFSSLPAEVKKAALADYRLWKQDPYANGLHFKEINDKKHIWSVRAGLGWRALGARDGDEMVWYWIGSHGMYNRLIKNLRKKNVGNIQEKAS